MTKQMNSEDTKVILTYRAEHLSLLSSTVCILSTNPTHIFFGFAPIIFYLPGASSIDDCPHAIGYLMLLIRYAPVTHGSLVQIICAIALSTRIKYLLRLEI